MQFVFRLRLVLGILLLLPLSLAQADIYKCVQADGSLLYADAPCPDTSSGTRLSQEELDARTSNLGTLAPAPAQEQPPRAKQAPTARQLAQEATTSYQHIKENGLPKPEQVPLSAWIGLGIMFIGGIGFLIAAFRASIWWGLGCLLIPFVNLIFLFLHWQDARNPFLLQLLGVGIALAGLLL